MNLPLEKGSCPEGADGSITSIVPGGRLEDESFLIFCKFRFHRIKAGAPAPKEDHQRPASGGDRQRHGGGHECKAGERPQDYARL